MDGSDTSAAHASLTDSLPPELRRTSWEIEQAPAPSKSLYCEWLWHSLTVLCDGTVTCGLDDPYKTRSYGNVKTSTLRDIFAREGVLQRRANLLAGRGCDGCGMHGPAEGRDQDALTPSAPFPKRLVIEPSIKCNLRCRNSTCDIANDATFHLRREDYLPFEVFCRLMNEAGPHIKDLYFYNYGEPFAHPRAVDMLAYAKRMNPELKITTSTNGILLNRPGAVERIVAEGLLDFICFTIGGMDQQTYQRYHKNGSFDKAFSPMRRMMEEKRRLGKTKPIVHWRYLLFHWNDSDECIAEALRLRDEIGVDEFRFMLSFMPIGGRSLRRAPGTPGFHAILKDIAFQDGYCADPYAEGGMYPPEHSEAFGDFCWTGASARVRAQVRSGYINLRLARHEFATVPLPAARISTPWGEVSGQVGMHVWQDNLLEVPQGFGGEVDVALDISPIFAPFRHIDSVDTRDLGIMIALDGVGPSPNPFRTERVSDRPINGWTRG
jgi:hypothetical protein